MAREEFEKHKSSIAYFWREKGDPTRYVDWDEEAVQRYWPEFYYAWIQWKNAERLLTAITRDVD